ncbi:MAG: SprT family zinc-dependent metalloprotease [Pseudomonadota bacterium]
MALMQAHNALCSATEARHSAANEQSLGQQAVAEEHILEGDPPIVVELRRHPRARRLTLRVASRDGRVTLTVPRGVPDREALAFARDRREWLSKHLGSVGARSALRLGDQVPVEGRLYTLEPAAVRAARIEGNHLLVPRRASEAPGRPAAAFLKLLARERLAAASDHYAAALGVRYSKLTLRDTRSRWGSCSSAGALMYSWRLAMAPPAVLDYVAAHEVSHLREMNHSPAFWATVARLMPDYAPHRRWLRTDGPELQRIVLD